ncbi:SRPBCC family protein [Mycolicibacterium pulveris]|uniref:Vanillate O-demethylase oxidoreductase VanB n=1 Tax=Mycolicibacterium pulveris TaxID=36813 RepID=A0A7I7UF61_MYCPV|nr:SRPBCC family protein [Mycolicibacterium pulveris]MCV6981695.1 SRPBCC family protein [Mycolicibacterium pulveris]BBY79309.1 vanillate O-demethylase oxidoreductase VanB [Mycolicibacterium pulveris]
MSSDRIEKHVVLKAPLERVWKAISDADQFGRWFGVRFDGPFVEGAALTGVMTPTAVDEEIAKSQEPYEGTADTWWIVAVEPPHRLAYRWRPYLVAGGEDGPTTLVEFTLQETADGVLLRIVESGFDAIPEDRRKAAFDDNSSGWAAQTELVRKYVAMSETV